MRIQNLHFKPFLGLSSRHLQMIISTIVPSGKAPPSQQWLIDIGNEDKLSCEVSVPPNWRKSDKTILLIHGLGGSHASRYMVRMARKLYNRGNKVVRVNLRGCGSGKGLSKLLYNAGNSQDLLKIFLLLNEEFPDSAVTLIGFSLGGSIALKLGGELTEETKHVVKTIIAICPPFDLERTVLAMQEKKNYIYHQYYLKGIYKQAGTTQKFQSVYDYDDKVTGPTWGFIGAQDYYKINSSKNFIDKISVACHILCAEDDPFVSIEALEEIALPENVHLWTTKYGSHMGFLGRKEFQWLDHLLLKWIKEDFKS
jgi:uncharacterized protein